MFNIRYGIKFMTEHVVFMSAADTSNDVMHFSWEEKRANTDRTRRKEKKHESCNRTEYDVLFASTVVCVYLFL